MNKRALLFTAALCVASCTGLQAEEKPQAMIKGMVGVWAAECYEMPDGKHARRMVTVKEDGSVMGDMVLYKDAKCTKVIKEVHKAYTMSIGKKSVGDDGKEAYEINKVGKTGWKVYTMIRMLSPTVIMPADRTKARDGSTLKLRANHFTSKTVQCKKTE
jgi:hypothetical protein